MSKDIWHKADEAPRYRFQCIYYHRDSKEYYFGEYDATFRVFLGKKTFHQCEAWKFAFAEDIIASLDELERTRKALELAEDKLKRIQKIYTNAPFNAPIDYANVCTNMYDVATEQIKELDNW